MRGWHQGGQTLDDFLGSSYEKDFLPLFDKFLGTAYGNGVLKNWVAANYSCR